MLNRRAAGVAIVGLVGALLCLRSVSLADVIQKWKTPKGGLYFGDRPPPGSTKIGQEGSNEPSDSAPSSDESPPGSDLRSDESPPGSDLDGKLSVEASRERAAIEKALNTSAARLEEVKKKIDETERLPDTLGGRMTSYADGTPTKPETLRALKGEKRKSLEDIAAQWKKFEDLNEKVRRDHGGSAPIWWRSKLTCSACPSHAAAEKALE